MDKEYEQRRRSIESQFETAAAIEASRSVELSPSGKFKLTFDFYSRGTSTWAYSRGRVTTTQDARLIADIKRNYSHFWHAWAQHANGNEYLLCGEDYQGQTVVNLSCEAVQSFFPQAAYKGHGFCWTEAHPSPDSALRAVVGCYWGGPGEIVLFDFSNPDRLPYTECARVSDHLASIGWLDNETFEFTCELDVRKSDGRAYEELSDAEQEVLDGTPDEIECVQRRGTIARVATQK